MGDIAEIQKQMTELRETLKADFIKYTNNVGRYMAQEIGHDLTDCAKSVIEEFYAQYNPKDPTMHTKTTTISRGGKSYTYNKYYYTRHYNFREVPRQYYKKRGDVYTGAVILDNNLPDVYKGMDSNPQQVFGRVIFMGLHGYASMGYPTGIVNIPPIFTPSPYSRLEKKRDEIRNNFMQYKQRAQKKAENDKYTYLFQ